MKEDKIIRFIRHELPDNEKEEVLNWIEASEQNRSEYNFIKNTWSLSQVPEDPVRKVYIQKYRALRRKTKPSRLQIANRITRYAAAFIIIAATGFLVSQLLINRQPKPEVYVYNVPDGQFSNMTLVDGTKVYFNSGSSISFGPGYGKKNREVELTGEAFFEVAEGNKYPFTVKTDLIDVVATGTSFNIRSYPEMTHINITLVSGKVNLKCDHKDVANLIAGQNFSVEKESGSMNIMKVNTHEYTSWIEGVATFRSERLEEISKLLERWYDVDIIFVQESLKDILLTGTVLKDKPIDYIIESLEITSDIQFSIIRNEDKADSIILMKKNSVPMEKN
ncbi:MAG: FecR family protein [Deltaproteobacteria bacterium]|nr:FecR family protein [Deltaproteobacteria bacterium]